MITQALILAGGLGTRLRSIVNDRPKAMANLGEKPFLEYQIEFLRRFGIEFVVLCVGYLHEQIKEYFGDGKKNGVQIAYAIEQELLGTGGAIKNAKALLNDSFLALNGDSFLDLDLGEFARFHRASCEENQACLGSLALAEIEEKGSYGAITVDDSNRILSFKEKPTEKNDSKLISAGVYILENQALNFIPPKQTVSLEKETFPALLLSGYSLYGFRSKGFFVDIGTPQGYRIFQDYIGEKDYGYQEQGAA
ncbi:MAG: nucleotidyltransferase family protein [bacterium]